MKLQSLQQEMNSLENFHESQFQELKETQEALACMNEQKNQTQEQLVEIKDRLALQECEIKDLKNELSKSHLEIESVQSESIKVQRECESKLSHQVEEKSQIQSLLEREKQDLQLLNNEKELLITTLKQRLSQLEVCVEEQDQQLRGNHMLIDSLNARLSKQTIFLEMMNQDNQDTQGSTEEALKKRTYDAEIMIQNLQSQLDVSNSKLKELETVKEEWVSPNPKLNALKGQIDHQDMENLQFMVFLCPN